MSEAAEKSSGEKLEGVAFTFCKCATVALIFGRYALPAAALLSAALYIAAHAKGKRDTRCVIGPPLAVASFWVVITGMWVWLTYFPPEFWPFR